jgi:hypothetical protein
MPAYTGRSVYRFWLPNKFFFFLSCRIIFTMHTEGNSFHSITPPRHQVPLESTWITIHSMLNMDKTAQVTTQKWCTTLSNTMLLGPYRILLQLPPHYQLPVKCLEKFCVITICVDVSTNWHSTYDIMICTQKQDLPRQQNKQQWECQELYLNRRNRLYYNNIISSHHFRVSRV